MLPPGYVARPLALEEIGGILDGPDVDVAHAIIQSAEEPLVGSDDHTRESIRAQLTNPDALAEQSLLVFDEAATPVGLLALEVEGQSKRVFIEAYADPDQAELLLPGLLETGLIAARRVALGDSTWEAESGAYEVDRTYRRVLEAAGFREVRRFWRMQVDLTGRSAQEPPAPDGVTRRIVDGDGDQRLMHEIFTDAFADHFGTVPRPYEEWITWFTERRDKRTDLWWIAELDGEPVGMCVQDDSRAADGASYVRTLGVRPAARGRGVARWLLEAAFAQAVREGRRSVRLTVDSENTTGATALYEAVGMAPATVIVLYRRSLALG